MPCRALLRLKSFGTFCFSSYLAVVVSLCLKPMRCQPLIKNVWRRVTLSLPQFHRLVGARACQHRAVRREGHRFDHIVMTLERELQLCCLYIPDSHRLVITAARQQLALRRESE